MHNFNDNPNGVSTTETMSTSVLPNLIENGHQQLENNHHISNDNSIRAISPQITNNNNSIIINGINNNQSTNRVNSILTNPRPWSADLPSTHSLHPQLDLKLNECFMLMRSLNDQIRELQTVIRDKTTSRGDFKFFADRLIRLVVEEGLNKLPIERVDVKTPTGHIFTGIRYLKGNCGVAVIRGGESMEQGLRDCCRSIRIGKILIENDENHKARVLYDKLPPDIAERKVLLLYPIMSTGMAVLESVKLLISYGVKEENIILLNLFSRPKAAQLLNLKFPKLTAITSDINKIIPNHFNHRYFGTD